MVRRMRERVREVKALGLLALFRGPSDQIGTSEHAVM